MGKRPPFPCERCGSCCRNIGGVEELKGLDRGDGVCKYLDTDRNLCTIYDTRPLYCRVEEMYDRFYRNRFSWEQFCQLNKRVCRQLQLREGWRPKKG